MASNPWWPSSSDDEEEMFFANAVLRAGQILIEEEEEEEEEEFSSENIITTRIRINRDRQGFHYKISWSTIVKTIPYPEDEKRKKFAKRQEAVRKDIERAFGVLQKKMGHRCTTGTCVHPKKAASLYVRLHFAP
ncbi:putative harbinger transposase-derived protein [Helianthus anomalus]